MSTVKEATSPRTVVDPVCGMTIDPSDAAGHVEHKGQTFYFCSQNCLDRFRADPEQFLQPTSASAPVVSAPVVKTEWTCPMHPEIVRDAPGACPICGMALEPRTVTLEEHNPELEDMTRRFRVSLLFTAPILALMVSEMLPGQPLQHLLTPAWLNWVQMALATPVVLWGGWPFFQRGWASMVNRHLNMFTLIALGVGAAYVFSVVATLAPGLFPDSFRMEW